MKKVFVSLPMRGRDDDTVLKEMEIARKDVEMIIGEPCELIDSFHKVGLTRPIECLGNSIQLMQDADIVCFAGNWMEARGCRVEHMVATEYEKEIITQVAETPTSYKMGG